MVWPVAARSENFVTLACTVLIGQGVADCRRLDDR